MTWAPGGKLTPPICKLCAVVPTHTILSRVGGGRRLAPGGDRLRQRVTAAKKWRDPVVPHKIEA